MSAIYDRDYFIAKFEAIPEEKWCCGQSNGPAGTHCALGWCDVETPDETGPEWSGLITLCLHGDLLIELVNDGGCERYDQPTPKARVLAALRDLPVEASA